MKISPFIVDQNSFSLERLKQALSTDDFDAQKSEEKWYELIRKLPEGLQLVLLAEINLGNYVTSIQNANWPKKGSVFVSLGMPFKTNFSTDQFDFEKRIFNDPHYWDQDIHQVVDGVEYLLIC